MVSVPAQPVRATMTRGTRIRGNGFMLGFYYAAGTIPAPLYGDAAERRK